VMIPAIICIDISVPVMIYAIIYIDISVPVMICAVIYTDLSPDDDICYHMSILISLSRVTYLLSFIFTSQSRV
jgi:hypothetical protein